MKIFISNDKKISTIQEEFTALFPYLKIEFFSKLHATGGSSSKRLLKSSNLTLGECRTVQNDGIMEIYPHQTVAELEQSFNKVYGLSVQVFRKSGKAWLETTVTDGWTLEQQNKQGEELSGDAEYF